MLTCSDEISLIFNAGSVCLIPYVDGVTVVRVRTVVYVACMYERVCGCEGDGHAGVGNGGGVVVSEGHMYGWYVGKRVVDGMKGVAGLWEMCMCLARAS